MDFDIVEKKLLKKKEFIDSLNQDRENVLFRIGRMVSEARMIYGYTQAELAKKLNTKQPAIARIENSKMNISVGLLIRMAEVFNTKLISPRFESMKDIEDEYDRPISLSVEIDNQSSQNQSDNSYFIQNFLTLPDINNKQYESIE